MFRKLFNRKKVTFYPKLYGLRHDENIVPAQSFKRSWIEKQTQIFKEKYEKWQNENGTYRVSSTHRCPGIKYLLNRGYILQAPKDYYIHTRGDINTPELYFPEKQGNKIIENADMSVFGADNIIGFERPFPEKTPNLVFKIILPYYVDCSDDMVLLLTGVSYTKKENFTVLPGILDPKQSNLLQVLFWWHDHDTQNIEPSKYFNCEHKSYYITKSTPLAQLIPIPRNYSTEYEIASQEEDVMRQKMKHDFHTQEENPQWFGIRKLVNYAKLRDNTLVWEKQNPKPKSKCPFAFLHKK